MFDMTELEEACSAYQSMMIKRDFATAQHQSPFTDEEYAVFERLHTVLRAYGKPYEHPFELELEDQHYHRIVFEPIGDLSDRSSAGITMSLRVFHSEEEACPQP